MATIATEVLSTALLRLRDRNATTGVVTDWKRRRGAEALNSLSPLERAAVVLCRRDGMTCEDIADRTGHSIEEIRAALASGLSVCVKYLSR